ncbi:MAG: ATP-binding protein [Tissierellia bacterium]|nr:ATP-binding protein [Tissierellia bacterium]
MDWKKHHRILIITGHFGSGKTELSINLALHLRGLGESVRVVDLDIINTYFRLRDKEELLEGQGIDTIYTAIKAKSLDIPALDPAIEGAFLSGDRIIVDVGGNPSGARALGRFYPVLEETGYEQIFVINANRPETQSVEDVVEFMTMTQATSQTQITSLFNTTHMLKATTAEDVLMGIRKAQEVSDATGLPLLGTVCLSHLVEEVQAAYPELYILPIDLYFRDPWML